MRVRNWLSSLASCFRFKFNRHFRRRELSIRTRLRQAAVVTASLIVTIPAAASDDKLFDEPGPSFAGGQGGVQIVTTDINGDGNADIAELDADDNLTVFLGDSSGEFEAQPTLFVANNTHAIDTSDLDGDGNGDLLVLSDRGDVTAYLGQNDGTLTQSDFLNSGTQAFGNTFVVADFNGDGFDDVATGHYEFDSGLNTSFGSIQIALGNGDGTSSPLFSCCLPAISRSKPTSIATQQ